MNNNALETCSEGYGPARGAERARSSRSGLSVHVVAFAVVIAALAGCTSDEPKKEGGSGGGGEAAAPSITNRIDIPPAVVQNLGIEFAKAERRQVDRTLRMPGAFESPPEAERNYRVPVAGRVELKIAQYGRVQPGDVIAEIDSTEWRAMQSELDSLDAELAERRSDLIQAEAARDQANESLKFFPQRIAAYDPQLAAVSAHIETLQKSRDLWQARVTEIEGLIAKGAGRAAELTEARAEAASAESALSEEQEKQTELERVKADLKIEQELARVAIPALEAAVSAAQNKVEATQRSFDLKLRSAASQLDLPLEMLKDDKWRALDSIPVKAAAPGVVLDLDVTNGELVEAGQSLSHVLDDSKIRFRARGLQADLGKLKNGLSAKIVPPAGGTLQNAAAAEGSISLAPMADADARLVDVIVVPETVPEWARPGVSAELAVVWDQSGTAELAVPSRALIKDGLDTIMFVRDMQDPNKVIRTVAKIGPSDGRWTVVYSGVMSGSEVVVEGTYELKLTGAGKTEVEGHFHADGTFHAGKHSDDE